MAPAEIKSESGFFIKRVSTVKTGEEASCTLINGQKGVIHGRVYGFDLQTMVKTTHFSAGEKELLGGQGELFVVATDDKKEIRKMNREAKGRDQAWKEVGK